MGIFNDDDDNNFLDDFFGGLGGSFRKLTPFQYELDCKYPIEFNKETNANDLYWNYVVKVEFGDNMVCMQYATDYESAVKSLLNMPKGKAKIESFHSKIMRELKEKRNYKYFYN